MPAGIQFLDDAASGTALGGQLILSKEMMQAPETEHDARDRWLVLSDALRSAEIRGGWNWFPEHAEPPLSDNSAGLSVLVENIFSIYDSAVDWLEVTFVIAWGSPPDLLVNASVEVACWCSRDHGTHYIEDARWPVTTAADLLEAFADATSTVRQWVREGPREPSSWRRKAGLPDSPDS